MAALRGTDVKALCDALGAAFAQESELKQLARFALDTHLDHIVLGDNLSQSIFQLVTWAESHELLDQLIDGALELNRSNEQLARAADQVRGVRLSGPAYRPGADIQPVFVTEPLLAFRGPDTIWPALRDRIVAARRSVLIGVALITSDAVKSVLLAAIARGVRVSILTHPPQKNTEAATLLRDLAACKAECVEVKAVRSHRQYDRLHEKVIVVDDAWSIVLSANLTRSGVPPNDLEAAPDDWRPGNREVGVAVRSYELAAFLTDMIRYDIAQERLAVGRPSPARPEGESSRTTRRPVQLTTRVAVIAATSEPAESAAAPAREKTGSGTPVLPLLTPDDSYFPIVQALLRSAERSILIQHVGLRSPTSSGATLDVARAIKDARSSHGDLDVRIVLSAGAHDLKLFAAFAGIDMASQIRSLDPAQFTSCHSSLLIVDGRWVVVGSHNLSKKSDARSRRDVSLLFDSRGLAGFFAEGFESDWQTGLPARAALCANEGETVERLKITEQGDKGFAAHELFGVKGPSSLRRKPRKSRR